MVRRLSTPNLITLEPTTIVPLPIAYGGTGATSALDALKNLHAISLNEKGAPNGVATLDANGVVPLNQLPPTSVDSVTLSGPTQVLPSSTTIYRITNYTNQITYSATARYGRLTLVEDALYYQAPATPTTDTITINTSTFYINITANVITPARILTDTKSRISLSPTFQKLNAQVPASDVIVGSRWELSTSAFFDTLIASIDVTGALNTWKPNVTLSPSTTYYLRVKDIAKVSGDTGWSATCAYTTFDAPYWVSSIYTGSDKSFNAVVPLDSNLYCVGSFTYQASGESSAISRAYYACYDRLGTLQWQKILLTPTASILTDVIALGNILYAVGYITTSSGSAPLLIAFDKEATLLWQVTLSGSRNDLLYRVTTDGTYLYACGAQSTNAAGSTKRQDAFLIKYDTMGTLQWQISLGIRGADDAFSAITCDGSLLYVAGYMSGDFYLSAWDSQANLLWQVGTTLINASGIYTRIISDASSVYVSGAYSSGSTRQGYVARFTKSGVLQWHSTVSSAKDDYFSAIAQDDTTLYLSTVSTATSTDTALLRFTKSGLFDKALTLSGSATKLLQYVTCANNRLYATGYLTSLSAGTKDTLAVCTPTALNLALAPLPSTNLSTLSFTSPTYKVNAANLSYATKNYASYTTSLTPTSVKYPSIEVTLPVSTSLLY